MRSLALLSDHNFFRIINCPTRGLGQKFEEQFHALWQQEPLLNFNQIAQKLLDSNDLGKSKQEIVQTFVKMFTTISYETPASKALEHFIRETNYRTHIKDSYEPDDANTRLENVKELIRAVAHFEEQKKISIQDLLDEIALMQAQYHETQDTNNPVLLMTLHAAKGLEFDVVILSGMEDGLLPSSRSLMDSDAIEEERRLLYVGITRAKEYLLFTHSRYRYTFGSMTDQRPSRFLKEIPSHLLNLQDCSNWHASSAATYLRDWLGHKTPQITSTVKTFSAASSAVEPVTKREQPSNWRKNQPVQHDKFGIGIIKEIETRSDSTYLTIAFKTGTKKIASTFISVV